MRAPFASRAHRDLCYALAWALAEDAALVVLTGWHWSPAEEALRCGSALAQLSPPAPPFGGRALQVTIEGDSGAACVLERTVPSWLFPDDGPGPDGGERAAA